MDSNALFIMNNTQFQQTVIDDLQYIRVKLDSQEEKITKNRVNIGKLQVKSGLFGILGGLLATALMFIIKGIR